MKEPTVNNSLQSMYDDYYHNNDKTLVKRELTALETVNHIQAVCDISKLEKIIDVGAGEGSLLECLSKLDYNYELYGVEISTSGVETIESKKISKLIEVSQFDGYKIPYPDKYFDLAVCIHVLEHVEHERLFLNELKRVAKRVIIEVPLEHTFALSRAIEVSGPHGHINFYTQGTFLNLIETCSIKVVNFRVLTFSQQFECFISGKSIGLIKHSIRNMLLALIPKLAPSLMVYFCIVVCEDCSNATSE
jgi:ubiquinone/menaquinone biosynthesis C-methylase UbiE